MKMHTIPLLTLKHVYFSSFLIDFLTFNPFYYKYEYWESFTLKNEFCFLKHIISIYLMIKNSLYVSIFDQFFPSVGWACFSLKSESVINSTSDLVGKLHVKIYLLVDCKSKIYKYIGIIKRI